MLERRRTQRTAEAAAGFEAAFSRGKRPLSWYDAICLLEEMVAVAKSEGDLDRLESTFLKSGGMPWTA